MWMKWSAHDHHESGSCSLRVRGARSSSSLIALTVSSASARPRLSLTSIWVRFTAAASHIGGLRRDHGWAANGHASDRAGVATAMAKIVVAAAYGAAMG